MGAEAAGSGSAEAVVEWNQQQKKRGSSWQLEPQKNNLCLDRAERWLFVSYDTQKPYQVGNPISDGMPDILDSMDPMDAVGALDTDIIPEPVCLSELNSYQLALYLLRCGLSPLVLHAGEKVPVESGWNRRRDTPMTAEEVRRAWPEGTARGVGVVCGYRRLAVLDFDRHDTRLFYDDWFNSLPPEAQAVVNRAPIVQTGSGGVHLYLRLAEGVTLERQNPVWAHGKRRDGEGHSATIEVKSNGQVVLRREGYGYRLAQGDLANIPTVSAAVWQAMRAAAEALDEAPPAVVPDLPEGYAAAYAVSADRNTAGAGDRPGDEYNSRGADHRALLEGAGWRCCGVRADSTELWTRPGKRHGLSATWNYDGKRRFHVFTSNAAPLEPGRYTLFGLRAVLQHGGDYKACTKELAGMGYGTQIETKALNTAKPGRSVQHAAPEQARRTFQYADAEGVIQYEVHQLESGQRTGWRYAANGDLLPGLSGVKALPYRLPQLLQAVSAAQTVYVALNEADVEALVEAGVEATCAYAKWTAEAASVLSGAQVVLVLRDDQLSRDVADQAGALLQSMGCAVQAVVLSHSAQIAEALNAAPEAYRQGALSRPEGYLEIVINDRPTLSVLADIQRSLVLANKPPRLFVQHGAVVRFSRTEAGLPAVERATPELLQAEMVRAAGYVRLRKDTRQHCAPPRELATLLLAGEHKPYPPLAAVSVAPFINPKGALITAPGYDDATRMYYAPPEGFKMDAIPDQPTQADAVEAACTLLDVLSGFPFADDQNASVANALALILTPLIRPSISTAPLALVRATKCGTGKTLLAEVCSLIATGSSCVTTVPDSSDEFRKKITSLLMAGEGFIILDNVNRRLNDAELAALLTAETFQDRMLGSSTRVNLRNCATWCATGNNVQMSTELTRRAYLIDLFVPMSQPFDRNPETFKYPKLRQHVVAHRGALLAAAATMVRAWIAAGMPKAAVPNMGSFEEWVATLGGILAYAGVPGFLRNKARLLAETDTEEQQWVNFLLALERWFKGKPFGTGDVYAVLESEARPTPTYSDDGYPVHNTEGSGERLTDLLPEALVGPRKRGAVAFGLALKRIVNTSYGDENIRLSNYGVVRGTNMLQIIRG